VNLNRWWTRVARTLPIDGQGAFSPADDEFADLRRWASARWRRRQRLWTRVLLVPAARCAWYVAIPLLVRQFARALDLPASARAALRVQCLRSGAQPVDAWIWHHVISRTACHPLPGRAASMFLAEVGDPAASQLLADKLAAADLLEAAGLATPPLLAVIRRGVTADLDASPWLSRAALFVKPRHGAARRGTLAIDVLGAGLYGIDGGAPVGRSALLERMRIGAAHDDLLVQARLTPASEIVDLMSGDDVPVLRVTTAREPNGQPIVHSALLEVHVPGERPRDFIRAHLHVPIELRAGELRSGVWFARPDERYSRLPWNAALLDGRPLAGLRPALAAAVRAMQLLPGVPLVNWDIVVTPQGPVILEGNTAGNWILTILPERLGVETVPVVPLLRRWANEIDRAAPL